MFVVAPCNGNIPTNYSRAASLKEFPICSDFPTKLEAADNICFDCTMRLIGDRIEMNFQVSSLCAIYSEE